MQYLNNNDRPNNYVKTFKLLKETYLFIVGLCFLIKKVSLYNNLTSEQSKPITSTYPQHKYNFECALFVYIVNFMLMHCITLP